MLIVTVLRWLTALQLISLQDELIHGKLTSPCYDGMLFFAKKNPKHCGHPVRFVCPLKVHVKDYTYILGYYREYTSLFEGA